MTKLNTCPAVALLLAPNNVGALPPFHVIESGQVNVEDNEGYMLFEEADGDPTAVIVPGFTAPTVVEEVSWQHKSLVLVIFVSAAKGGVNP